MILVKKLFGSSIGKKALMAVTGGGLILFLIAHLSGNLLMFAGPDAMNSYAEFLKSKPALLWTARLGLLGIFVIHLLLGVSLTIANRRARGGAYAYENTVQASLASRSMILTGLVIFFYLAYHLLHFTLGGVHGEYFHLKDNLGRHDVYSMVVLSFQQPLISVVYILAMFFMAVHLSHGLPSLFQSLGANSPRFENGFKRAGISVAVLLFLGFSSIPAAILAGLVKLP